MFVFPTTSWILKPGRFPRQQSIIYAISFLALLAAIKTGSEIYEMGDNHYVVLGASRDSTPMEIKRAYKRLSLELHPDKNSSPNAADEFQRVKESYDVLMDVENRVVYNKFGPDGIKNNKSTFDEQALLFEMGIFYATWFMLAYILTMGKKSSNSRTYIFTGLIVMLLVEITLMTTENPFPSWWFPTTTEFEWIWLIHVLFPAYMNGCRSLGGFLYVDVEDNMKKIMVALHDQNRDIMLVMRDIQLGVHHLAKNGVIASNSGNPEFNSNSNSNTNSNSNSNSNSNPMGKIKELEERISVNNVHVAQAVTQLKQEGAGGSGYGFYLMIIGYIFISYIF